MSNAKTILIVDEAVKAESRERVADRTVLIKLVENELNQLHELVERLTERVLEAGPKR